LLARFLQIPSATSATTPRQPFPAAAISTDPKVLTATPSLLAIIQLDQTRHSLALFLDIPSALQLFSSVNKQIRTLIDYRILIHR
jgi:hypothetical protein